MQINIIREIKNLNISIGKMLFSSEDGILGKHPKPLQIEIINYLSKNQDKVVYQKNLEENLKISKAAISEVLINMERNGFIEKINDTSDARRKRVVLSSETKKMHEDIEKKIDKLNDTLLDGINNDDLNIFIKVINKLKDNMKKEGV